MAGIADVCARVLRSVSKEICAAIFEDGQGQLILLGHCIVTDTPRVFVLSVATTRAGVGVTVEEILTTDGEEFFGSGASAARTHLKNSTDVLPYQVVRAVANDPAVPSVGGNIQFGILEGPDFRVTGIRDFEVNHDRNEFYVGYYFAGLEIHGSESLLGNSGFAIATAFLNPFEGQIQDLLTRRYAPVPSKSHW